MSDNKMTTTTPPAKRERLSAEQRKGQLLDHAASLVQEVGVEGLHMSSVANRAGIAKQLVQYHFGSREELLAQLWDREYERTEAAIATALGTVKSLEETVRLWLDTNVASTKSATVLDLLSASNNASIQSRVLFRQIHGVRSVAMILQREFGLSDSVAIAAAGMIASSILGFVPSRKVSGLSEAEGAELFVRMCIAAATAAAEV